MAARMPPPLDVTIAFVTRYYKELNESRENLAHKFFKESSKLIWPGSEGGVVTTLSSINDKILSSEYKDCRAVVRFRDVPGSHLGAVFVAVTGKYVDKKDPAVVRANFFQSFILSENQEKEEEGGLFILNDYLQVLDAEKAAAASPAGTHPAEVFVREYYTILNKSREKVHKLYAESSKLLWPDSDGVVRPVKSKDGKIMSSDYKDCSAEVSTVVIPASRPEAVFVAVRGKFLDKGDAAAGVVRAYFFQNFILTKDDKGLFVILNDYLRVVEEKDVAKKRSLPRAVAAAPVTTPPPPHHHHPETREVFVVNLPKEVSQHRIAEVLKRFGPVKRPAANSVNIGTRDNSDGSYTYFALVEFQSPESARLAVEARFVRFGKKKALIAFKKAGGVSVPPEDSTSTPRAAAAPKSAGPVTRGVFVDKLPTDATKNSIAGLLKKFGPVRRQSNAVQLWTEENWNGSYTTSAFVEFESPDSARLAVEAGFVLFGEKEASIEYKKPRWYPSGNSTLQEKKQD